MRELKLKPSEYVKKHLKFTPFAGEPVGWMIEQAGAELFMFSTDFPHPEGGRDPLAKFEAEMASTTDQEKHQFFYGNMAELLDHHWRRRPSTPDRQSRRGVVRQLWMR